MTVTYNPETQRYCIPQNGGGFSCLGYQVAYDRAYRLRAEIITLNLPIPPGIPDDPMERYQYLKDLQSQARQYHDATGYRFTCELHPRLIGKEGQRARYFDESLGKQQSFIVGKSTGWIPVHLEIKTRRSLGGCSISCNKQFRDLTFEPVK